MHILSVEAVSKDYRMRRILENVSLGFDSADRVGVVGVNGSGKTTLLRVVAGEESPDAGRVTFAEGVTVGYLPQNPQFAGDVEWNFAKFLINRKGEVVARFPARTEPTSPEVLAAIEKALAESAPAK